MCPYKPTLSPIRGPNQCIGRMEYLLLETPVQFLPFSPDEKDPLLTQKGRQELWKRIQDMAREIDRQDRESTELKEELTRTRKQFDEYRKMHPEMVGVKNGKAYIATIDRKGDAVCDVNAAGVRIPKNADQKFPTPNKRGRDHRVLQEQNRYPEIQDTELSY